MTFTRVLTNVINKCYSRIGTLVGIKHSYWLKKSHDLERPIRRLYFRYAAINFVYDINSCQLLKNIFLQYESQKSFES